MTAAELIAELQKYPDNLEVKALERTYQCCGGCTQPYGCYGYNEYEIVDGVEFNPAHNFTAAYLQISTW